MREATTKKKGSRGDRDATGGTRHRTATWLADLHAVALTALVLRLPAPVAWWCLYALGASANLLAFTVLNQGVPRELAGRANTALNVLMFGGSFLTQWGVGVAVEQAQARLGLDVAQAFVVAFAVVLGLLTGSLLWLARGWRRHAAVVA